MFYRVSLYTVMFGDTLFSFVFICSFILVFVYLWFVLVSWSINFFNLSHQFYFNYQLWRCCFSFFVCKTVVFKLRTRLLFTFVSCWIILKFFDIHYILLISVVIGTDCKVSHKSNYHTITSTTALKCMLARYFSKKINSM
jgi:hypothetical protein